jgi:hypothetical protein
MQNHLIHTTISRISLLFEKLTRLDYHEHGTEQLGTNLDIAISTLHQTEIWRFFFCWVAFPIIGGGSRGLFLVFRGRFDTPS